MAYLDKQIYNTLTIWVELYFNLGDGMWVLRGYINLKMATVLFPTGGFLLSTH